MAYDIGVRNVLRVLGSPYSYLFWVKSDLEDVERAIAAKLCKTVNLGKHEGIPHILEKDGHHAWGRYTHRSGLLLTEKGKDALNILIEEDKKRR